MSKTTDILYKRGYDRGIRAGRVAGYEVAFTIIMYKLYSLGFTEDEMYKLKMEMEPEWDKISKNGELYFQSIKRKLKNELGITFRWPEKAGASPPLPEEKLNVLAKPQELKHRKEEIIYDINASFNSN